MHQLLEPVAGHSVLGGGEIIKLQRPPAFQLSFNVAGSWSYAR
jgi:hypothetical protein